jgi:hypothetical protein
MTSTLLKQKLKEVVKPFAILLLDNGFDPRRLIALRHYPKYISHSRKFKKLNGTITHKYPILTDYDGQAGSASGHYFHQDLLVASFVYTSRPDRHIDIGSRIDGFVAHVASFRKIEVMDVRDLNDTGHPNISFLKADLMDETNAQENLTDSISCLHAIEHFGLGRYGDPLDPKGHIKGFNNILKMLKDGGTLYISFPIGQSNEVHFNGHRVFSPKDIFNWIEGSTKIELARFDFVDDVGQLHRDVDLNNSNIKVKCGCGIYTFKKLESH